MKYFEVSVLFFNVLLLVGLWKFIKARLQHRFYRAYILRKSANYFSKSNCCGFFSEYIVLKIADIIHKAPRNKQEELLKEINSGKHEKIVEYITTLNPTLAYIYTAHFDIKAAKEQLEKHIKEQKSALALIGLGLIYAQDFNFIKLRSVVESLKTVKKDKLQKALSYILEAKTDIYDSDMLSASSKTMKSLKIFKKKNLFYQEADAYFILGEIYRISAVFDVSQMMFDAADKIYASVEDVLRQSVVKSAKAMLFTAQERFTEATDLFAEAEKIFKQNKLPVKQAEVLNQQALIHILQKKYAKALKIAEQALKIHTQHQNMRGQAYSYELLATISYNKKDYLKAVKFSQNAQPLYFETDNYSAYEDAAFIEAQSYFALQDYEKTEKICRKIISIYEKKSTCFHIANIYSLLGLIYIRLNDFKRAGTLFKKALDLEQSNERYSCVATDYANLALIDKKLGNKEQALQNLQAALESAQKHQDENLCQIISKQIKKIG